MAYYNVNSENGNLIPVAGGTLYADTPIGTIISSGAAWDNPPAGYLFCGGQAISRVTYAALFAVIGTTFGAGDGSTTFNVPELRGEFLRGAGTNQHAGQGNGSAPGYHQDATEIQGAIVENTTHRIVFGHSSGNTPVVKTFDSFNLGDISGVTYYTKEADIEGAEFVNYLSVRPTNTSVNFFIKATNVAVPADFMNSVNSIYGPLIPSNASASNKLVAASDTVKRKDVTITATASIEDDIKTLLDTLIAETSGVYAGYFTRTGNTSGHYSVSIVGTWNVVGIVSICGATSAAYRVAKFKNTEQGAYTYTIEQLAPVDTVQSGTYTIPAQTIANGAYAELEIPLVPNDFYCGRIDFGNLPSVNMSLSYNDFSGSFQDTRSTEQRQQYVLYPIGKANLATLHVYLTNYTGSPVTISNVSVIYYLEHHKAQ